MNRLEYEQDFWEEAAKDKKVSRYIADKSVTLEKCTDAILPSIKVCKNVLEIGSGIGRLTISFAKKLKKTNFFGVDISRGMIYLSSKKASSIKNVLFEKNDGRTLPKHVIDGAYSMLCFQHITAEGVRGYIKQIGSMLSKGGVFRFQFVEGNEKSALSQQYHEEEIRKWCEEAGLKVTDYEKGLIYPVWTWVTAIKS